MDEAKGVAIPRVNATKPRALWARQYKVLLEKMSRLEKLEGELVKISPKLTLGDIAEKAAVLKVRNQIANGFGAKHRAIPDEGVYAYLLASTERFREETERAIAIVEKLLERYSPAPSANDRQD